MYGESQAISVENANNFQYTPAKATEEALKNISLGNIPSIIDLALLDGNNRDIIISGNEDSFELHGISISCGSIISNAIVSIPKDIETVRKNWKVFANILASIYLKRGFYLVRISHFLKDNGNIIENMFVATANGKTEFSTLTVDCKHRFHPFSIDLSEVDKIFDVNLICHAR